jgi:hypothetical protein
MGVAQHGMEDEVFDSIFMRKSIEVEGAGQDYLDPGTDFLLVEGGTTKLTPEVYYPDDITAVYATMGIEVDERWIKSGTRIVRDVVIGLVENPETVKGLADEYRDDITWAALHFLDEDTPGSHAFEISLVAPYVASIWHRLHGQILPSDVIIGQVPPRGQRLLANSSASVDSWVSIFLGVGVLTRTLTAANVQVVDAIGEPQDVEIGWVIWSGADDDTRLIQIRPVTDWVSGAEYTVTLGAKIETVAGTALGLPFQVTFNTACDTDARCSPLPAVVAAPPLCLEQPNKSNNDAAKRECGVAPSRRQALPLWLVVLPAYCLLRRRAPKSNV